MIVRLHHPEHGWTHAYTEFELEILKLSGWKEEEEEKPKDEPKEETGVVE